jgi:hypothetical protein
LILDKETVIGPDLLGSGGNTDLSMTDDVLDNRNRFVEDATITNQAIMNVANS